MGTMNPWCSRLGEDSWRKWGSDGAETQWRSWGAGNTPFLGLAAGYNTVFTFVICYFTVCMLGFNKYVC